MIENDLILAIETTVQGGSLSILHGDVEIDNWCGTQAVSKSEDVLREIKKLLERNALEKKSIKRIVVSRGPGSYTGFRIGAAIGFGLKKALNCEMFGANVLEALTFCDDNNSEVCQEIITAVPLGRYQMCWQSFKVSADKTIICGAEWQYSEISVFFNRTYKNIMTNTKMIFQQKLFQDLQTNQLIYGSNNIRVINAGNKIASLLGLLKNNLSKSEELLPIYIKDN